MTQSEIDLGSVWDPLPEAGRPDGYTKDFFIVHSVGNNIQTAKEVRDNYFAQPDVVVESTWIVGWGPEDPTRQLMYMSDRADANGLANRRGVSVEVVGDGTEGYNNHQRRELIRLGVLVGRLHSIPWTIARSHLTGGYAWHIQFGAPGPWTSVAKTCPGQPRIEQLEWSIFPRIISILTHGGDDMFDSDDADRLERLEGKVNEIMRRIGSTPPGTLFDRTHRTLTKVTEIHDAVFAVDEQAAPEND